MKTKLKLFATAAIVALTTAFSANAQSSNITSAQLPSKALDFLKKHFTKETVSYAKVEKEMFDTEYKVYLSNGTEIEFDGNGNWEDIDGHYQPLPVSVLPKAINTHIKQNFDGQKIIKSENKSWGYEIELLDGTELEFNNAGKFIRIDR